MTCQLSVIDREMSSVTASSNEGEPHRAWTNGAAAVLKSPLLRQSISI
jgi:hypothetical protein